MMVIAGPQRRHRERIQTECPSPRHDRIRFALPRNLPHDVGLTGEILSESPFEVEEHLWRLPSQTPPNRAKRSARLGASSTSLAGSAKRSLGWLYRTGLSLRRWSGQCDALRRCVGGYGCRRRGQPGGLFPPGFHSLPRPHEGAKPCKTPLERTSLIVTGNAPIDRRNEVDPGVQDVVEFAFSPVGVPVGEAFLGERGGPQGRRSRRG